MIKIRGTSGFLDDLEPEDMPLNAVTEATNFTIDNGYPASAMGYESIWGATPVTPYWCMPYVDGGSAYWIYASLTKAYRVPSSGTDEDITRYTTTPGDDDYTGTAENIWNGGVLGEIPIINNGVDEPQEWDSALVRFKDLSNWTAGDKCKTIRVFKEYLIALNVTKSGTSYPHMVKWSHFALPGAVPTSWDETDNTVDAGEKNLLNSTGVVVDGGQLRDFFIIYKEDSTHLMRFIGGNEVFSFDELFKTHGILAVNCWAEYKGLHYVLTQGDIIAHDGFSVTPIATRRVRDYLFNSIDATNYYKAFVTLNPKKEEVWFCYPTTGSTNCNKALVYHVTDKKWSIRDLPGVGYIGHGIVEGTENNTYDTTSETYDSIDRAYNSTEFSPAYVSLLYCSVDDSQLYKGDTGNTANGTNLLVSIEKTGNAHYTNNEYDESVYKYVSEIWPRIQADDGTQVSVSVATQSQIGNTITWSSPQTFTVGIDRKVDFDVSAPYWGVKFYSQSDINWKLQGYDVKVAPQGEYV